MGIRTRSAEKTNTIMRSFAVIATVASIAALSSASTLTEMYVKMADCSGCGMGSLGALSVKVSFVLTSVKDISAGKGVTVIHQICTNFLSKVCGQAPVSSTGGQC